MPPRKKPKKVQTPLLLRFLPEFAQVFVARRIMDITAGVFMLAGIFTLLCLMTYNPGDASSSVAQNNAEIQNYMGSSGAYLSDLFIQSFGAASYLFALFPILWGIFLFKRRSIRPISLRIVTFGLAVFSASLALSIIPAPSNWFYPWLGGPIGGVMSNNLQSVLPFSLFYPLALLTLIFSALFTATFSKTEAVTIGHKIVGFIKKIALFTAASTKGFVEWVQHYNDPVYRAERKSKIVTSKKTEEITLKRQAPSVEAKETKQTELVREPASPTINVAKTQAPKKVSQSKLRLSQDDDFELPDIDLLQDIPPQDTSALFDKDTLRKNAEMLQSVLADFNVQGDITAIHPGPVVTLYELEPAPGTKSQRVISLADDIARSMSAISVRCAVVPGRNVIGIELPNERRQTVFMRDLLETTEVQKSKATLPLILGKDIGGKPIIGDLAKMPHLLVAGTTGSGKSVAINTMILSLIYRLPPEKCRFIMVDPKMLELSVYDDIPHLLSPVVTEPGKAVVSLKWTVAEMEDRYRAMSKLGVRNIEGYNQRIREARDKGEILMRKIQTGFDSDTGKPVYEEQPLDLIELPYIVVIVDEFADLMLVAGKDVENAIQRLAQMARAAGIHLIMATQRPSVDVITGVVKANFPTRISFAVTSKIDSRTILGDGGAEQLLGMGDMLYMSGGGRINRVHGPFVSDDDVENVVTFMKSQAEPQYVTEVTEGGDYSGSEVMGAMFGDDDGDKVDELYDEAVAIIAREGKASTSFIQRHLQIGYNRAARIIEEMERQGVVSPATKTGKREVLISDHSGYQEAG
jgi:S-DNA-T family DNA segregation ATPase FtsK/SpoIIIE